jgi:glycine cleavage system H protein
MWASREGDLAIVGITKYAADQLGEVVYLDLPQVGDELAANDGMGSVESVKSISDLYIPVGGRIVEVNEPLLDEPAKINEDPYGSWLVKLAMTASQELDNMLDNVDYEAKLG